MGHVVSKGRVLIRRRTTTLELSSIVPEVGFLNNVTANSIFLGTINQRNMEIIKKTWKHANADRIGMKILTSLIIKKPIFARNFAVEEGLTEEELEAEVDIVAQAQRIQGFLDTIISLLGEVPFTVIQEHAHRIGSVHYLKGVNFTSNDWDVFRDTILEEIVTEKVLEAVRLQFDEVRKVWLFAVNLIVKEMKQGFLDEALRNCRNTNRSHRLLLNKTSAPI